VYINRLSQVGLHSCTRNSTANQIISLLACCCQTASMGRNKYRRHILFRWSRFDLALLLVEKTIRARRVPLSNITAHLSFSTCQACFSSPSSMGYLPLIWRITVCHGGISCKRSTWRLAIVASCLCPPLHPIGILFRRQFRL
jgi:hypothetical protein